MQTDFLTKKTKVNEGEIPQYYVENNHEAIIDPETFEMVQKELTRAALTDFQKALASRQQLLTKFDDEAWYTLVDYATVYNKDDIRFTFKNGTEIKA